MHAVEVKSLYKTFGKNVILNNIDLEMEAVALPCCWGHLVVVNPPCCV